jgi:cytochrome c biogenesis protein CcmG/thiol:disulfide interchange protein DsbE
MNRTVLVIGILITAAIVALFAFSFGRDPQHINSPLVGRVAPRFALRAVGTGEVIDIESLRGKPVVLNFWATWCMPCHAEHPILQQAARALGPDVQFVGVVFGDTEENIQAFIRERGEAYPTLLDDKGKTSIAYGVGGVPETFFIDRSGKIVAKYEGPLSFEMLQTYVRKVLS